MLRLPWIAILLFVFTNIQADFWFKNLETDAGLSLVRAICRDDRGYLWIGNDGIGLMRYDGYEIKRYLHDPNDSTTVNGDGIVRLLEDYQKQLWVGTRDGVCRYDHAQDRFIRYYFSKNDVATITSPDYINNIIESPDSLLWILSRDGIFLYDREKDEFNNVLQGDREFSEDYTSMAWDRQGRCWLAPISRNGLYHFDIENGEMLFYEDDNPGDIDFGEKIVYVDSEGLIWYGFYGRGLALFDPETGSFRYFSASGNGSGTKGKFIQSILEADANTLLIGIDQGGVNIYHKNTGKFDYATYNDPNYGILRSDGVYTLHYDYEGILWVGTSRGGISYYNPKESRFRTYQPLRVPSIDEKGESFFPGYGIIACFLEDSRGYIWIGTDGRGVDVFDRENQKFKHLDVRLANGEILELGNIRSFAEDEQGIVWITSWNDRVVSYNWRNKQFKTHDFSGPRMGGYNRNQYWSMSIDSEDQFWVTYPIGNVALFDRHGAMQDHFFTADTINSINTLMLESESNTRYILSWRGVFRYNDILKEMEQVVYMPELISMDFGKYESLWIGTGRRGLIHFDRNGNILAEYSMKDGLADNTINAVVQRGNEVWVSTNQGISRLNTVTKKITNFYKSDGLQGSKFFFQSSLETRDGKIFFGGNTGFSTFYPDSITPNDRIPPVYISSMYLLNRRAREGEDSIVNRVQIDHRKELVELNWDRQLSVEINYHAINYTFPHKTRYKYILEGLESEWNSVESHFRKAVYTNLSPGNYTFRVKACNNDELWNEFGAYLSIKVHPPFWRTYWFYGVDFLAFILLVYLIVHIRDRKIAYDRKKLQEKIKERTMLIQEQKEELEVKSEELAVQNEELYNHRNRLEKMVEDRTSDLKQAKEKAEESDRLKSLFLANMSHEIRTPMNAIVGFSELLVDPAWSEEERQQFVTMIQTNSDSLLNLIEDILDFSLMESNQLKIHIAPIALNEMLENTYSSFALRHENQEVEMRLYNTLQAERYTMESDEYRIQQILNNLISNALKFTDKGHVELGARIHGVQLELYVQDTGEGLSPDECKSIFDRFVKLEKDENEMKRGVGLGLSISQRLAQILGGELAVSSVEGEGSTFSFFLPKSILRKIKE